MFSAKKKKRSTLRLALLFFLTCKEKFPSASNFAVNGGRKIWPRDKNKAVGLVVGGLYCHLLVSGVNYRLHMLLLCLGSSF